MPNYCDGPYIHLCIYVNKVRSAWTEVWSCSYCSRAPLCVLVFVIWAFLEFHIASLLNAARAAEKKD